MTDQYASEYYDFLQTIRDREDELAQQAERQREEVDKRLSTLARLLNQCVTAMEHGVPRQEMVELWDEYAKKNTSLEPIAKFLFGNFSRAGVSAKG